MHPLFHDRVFIAAALGALLLSASGCQHLAPATRTSHLAPANGAVAVDPATQIMASFSGTPPTLAPSDFTLHHGTDVIAATLALDIEKSSLTLTPTRPLAPATTYTARLNLGTETITWSFSTRDIQSWVFVDGGAGLNWDPNWDTYRPQMTVLGDKLYAAWREMTVDRGPMHVHVAVYNGDDQAPDWKFIDGGASGINRNPRDNAFDIQITAFDSRLYAIWQEDNEQESDILVAVYNGNDDAPAWSFVVGEDRKGLNHDIKALASFPQLTVANGKLYAIWSEYSATAKQIRVAVYNGNDDAPAWRFVDGNTGAGINKDPQHAANYPQLTALGDKLYATWLENSTTSAHIRVAAYNGDDTAPRWTFVDEARGPGLNFDSESSAFYPELTAHAGKLYATWTETGDLATQTRVAVYNGDDQAPRWSFVDGNRAAGLNRNGAARAYRPQLTSFGDRLYVTWYEDDSHDNTQIRVAIYNGDDQAPAWRFVDGGGESGLNKNIHMTAVDSQLTVFNRKLYITWKELIGKRGQKIHVAVGQ